MGKGVASRHQRFTKAEQGKVKLKGKKDAKKELPKGTNVTKTNFKVKKIVLREQLKSADGTQPLSKTKLNVKELITRLGHFNTTARNDALNSLKDLISAHQDEVLANSLGQLIKGVAPLVLDRERSVRRESYKVLHVILSPLTLEKITPFFDILCSYLRCAMTHIDTAIHEDSLLFFDILLLCVPNLVACNVHKILPSFLDMISKMRLDSKPGRTLMVNLGSKMTSVKWRSKVLSRLHLLLQTLNDIKTKQKESNVDNSDSRNAIGRTQKFIVDKSRYFPIYRNMTLSKLSYFSRDKSTAAIDNEAIKLQSYIEVLTPLLFETWLEVKPTNANNSKKSESVISEEAATLLRSILQIINLLWNLSCLVESEERNVELSAWFLKFYLNNFSVHISSSFPYIQGKVERKKGGPKHNNKDEKILDPKCVEENLLISYLHIIIHSNFPSSALQYSCGKIFEYILETVENISNKSPSCGAMFIKVLQVLFVSESWTKLPPIMQLLEAIIQLYNDEKCDPTIKQNIFSLLTSILLSRHLTEIQKSKVFQSWLIELPKVICNSDSISIESFNIIYRLAMQDNALFNSSIKGKLKTFLQRIPTMKIVGISNDSEVKEKLISLLFWVKQWDTESLNILQDQLGSQCYENTTKEYLVDILKVKTEGIFAT